MISGERTIETTAQIQKRWKRDGRSYTATDIAGELKRQSCVAALEYEDSILAAAFDQPQPSLHTREVVGQIRDHRDCNGDAHALGCDTHHPLS